MVEQALQGSRGAIEWHGKLLAHDGDRHVHSRHPAQDIGHQIAALEALRVAAKGDLVVRRSVNVVEDRPGQALPCERAEIVEVVAMAQAHASLVPAL